jgi:hypothetical protein
MKIQLGNFDAKVRRENIIKPTNGNESLHQHGNDNGVKIVNFATSKDLIINSTMFHTETIISKTGPLLMGRLTTRLITC